MLYVFGDSLSSGFGFIEKGLSEKDSRSLSWPYCLSKKLNIDLVDFSFAGCSNWTMARIIQTLDLKSEDIVIVQWSTPYRFEMGVNDRYNYQKSENKKIFDIVDRLEENEKYKTKTMCRSLISKTSDEICKQYMLDSFNTFFNDKWFEDMTKVMITSVCQKLEKIGCKYILFDGWVSNYTENYSECLQYIFKGSTIAHVVREFPSNIQLPDKSHPTESESRFISDILDKKIKELYYSHNEDESCYIPELRKKYQPK